MEQVSSTNANPSEVKYAGFWLRFVAFLIDCLLLRVVDYMVAPLFVILLYCNPLFNEMDPTIASIGFMLITAAFDAIICWPYFALMESSAKQATLGKMVLNLKVTDMNGGKISFSRASARYFGKIVSVMTLTIGYIMAGVTEKKQALHDMMADCLVVKK